MTLTSDDVLDCLEDDRHNGYGLRSTMDCLRPSAQLRLARAVARQANALALTREELFWWTDSKYGRHLDVRSDMAAAEMAAEVAKLLQRRDVERLREDGCEALYAR